MLIEFSVTNFRSIRERQTLSMVAVPRLGKKENVVVPSVKGEKVPPLLKVAAIYGPNASGKSSLVTAFEVLTLLTALTPDARYRRLPVSGFRFDPDLAQAPSQFEVHFIQKEQRYEFSVSATQERITEERLVSFPGGKEVVLYCRKHVNGRDDYEFGDGLDGGDLLHETWRSLTGPQALFIAQAVANSNEDLSQLREPFSWLSASMTMTPERISNWANVTKRFMKANDWAGSRISNYLEDIDIPVTEIEVSGSNESEVSNTSKEGRSALKAVVNRQDDSREMTLTHRTALGEAKFDFEEESSGTKNLIGFWLPWSVLSSSFGSSMPVLWVDELDSSLHPELVAQLVRQLIATDNGAQLIFTTHDTHLMNAKLLRRDQFWITERDINGATRLNSIHDFEGREGEDIEKRYFEGRYRGLPIIKTR
jgi:hypothetical protein